MSSSGSSHDVPLPEIHTESLKKLSLCSLEEFGCNRNIISSPMFHCSSLSIVIYLNGLNPPGLLTNLPPLFSPLRIIYSYIQDIYVSLKTTTYTVPVSRLLSYKISNHTKVKINEKVSHNLSIT